MNNISKIILSISCLLLLFLNVNALEINEPQFNPNIIHPGDDVDVWIKLTNNERSGESIENLRVTVNSKYPFELKQVNPKKGVYEISHLNEGESDTAYFKLHISNDASTRDYRLDVTVSYDIVEYRGGKKEVISREYTKIYYIPVYGLANFEINSNGVTITPSRTEEVKLSVSNMGTGTAKQTTLTIGSNNMINPIDTTKYYLGNIDSGSTTSFNVKLHASQNTKEGSYLIPATLNWIDEDGTEKSENINIGFVVRGDINLGISNVITEPREIKAQDTYVRIDVDFTNNGHGEARNIQIDMLNEYPFRDSWSNANFKNIGTLTSGDVKTGTFYIDVDKDAKSGTYKIPLKITYLDIFNNEHVEIHHVNIFLKPKAVLEIVPEVYVLKAGRENKILLKVQNNGTQKAESVKITAIKNTAQPFDYPQKTDSIGTLGINETGQGILVIDVDKKAVNKDYFINIEIRSVGDSEQGDNNVYLSQKTVKVKVEGRNKSITIPAALIVLIIGFGGYYVYNKRKKGRSD
ncbi:conserved hypothetical protein [Methanococcus vannielii SB]|uniref:S-layer domain-like protein n=1 Tax=Methanococcus vannielii (strain ATCC 35089 / DSM 1224 / JCM 13029 / OCM 148 / SB) TaxID=406327 RepID=A6USU0_METVS|nr:COG1361 S-layer family protein [Methanococcus vannielii]ABR55562.1 conserved hypothetical protein [Methanococcus vannielii SB]